MAVGRAGAARGRPGDGATDTPDAALDRLRRLLGGELTEWLIRRAREPMAAGRPLTGTVTL